MGHRGLLRGAALEPEQTPRKSKLSQGQSFVKGMVGGVCLEWILITISRPNLNSKYRAEPS